MSTRAAHPAHDQAGSLRLGIDVGGTFTDLCIWDERTGRTAIHKVPTTPGDQSQGLIKGMVQLLSAYGAAPTDVRFFAHGTTAATNAMLERTFARVGLITTKGFRDILEVGRQKRPSVYDLLQEKPDQLVRRDLRLEVDERVGPAGEIIEPLDTEDVERAVRQLVAAEVEVIVICFINAYANPAHETEAAAVARSLVDTGVSVWTSSDVLPEFREFERFSTTAVNAVLSPSVSRYLRNLERGVAQAGLEVTPYIMQSNGGLMSIQTAGELPMHTLMSGPSAGVVAAAHAAREAGFGDIITFDMGGTSIDVAVVVNGECKVTSGREVAGYPVRSPILDIHSLGAGGGSLAYIDSGGRLKVGPQSMGADPGPASYGRGGTEPTVTDANVVLGRLNPTDLLDGSMSLDRERAWQAIERRISPHTGLDVVESAWGILKIVNANMMLATRRVSVENGYDPRSATLVAFGGAGPLHAAEVAMELGIRQVLIPNAPGIMCAQGLLLSDLRRDYVRSVVSAAADADLAMLNDTWQELEESAAAWLLNERVPLHRQQIIRTVDMRYAGQSHELEADAPLGVWSEVSLEAVSEALHQKHEAVYGYRTEGTPVEIVNLRVSAVGIVSKVRLDAKRTTTSSEPSPRTSRPVYWNSESGFVATPVFDRSALSPNTTIDGPAIIEQMDSTTVLPPDATATVDDHHNVLIQLPTEGI